MSKKPVVKKTKSERELCRVVTPEFQVSYPNVFKAANNMNEGGEKKFSVTMMFPKSTDLTSVKSAIKNAKIQAFGDDPKKWPKDLKGCVTDGDSPKFADKEGHAGCWIIKATSREDQRPEVVDQNVQPILDQKVFYGGCYAKAAVLAYVWDNQFGTGVGFILDAIQKTRDGKSFASRPKAEELFAPISLADTESFSEEQENSESFS